MKTSRSILIVEDEEIIRTTLREFLTGEGYSVADAATVSGTLWLSYLFALFYFLVAAGAVTHKDLLLESPVKLPFLGVDLPLKVFFLARPARVPDRARLRAAAFRAAGR